MRTIAGEFIQHIQGSLIFPLELQDCVGNGSNFWCLDWWVIEIAKYFFEGETEYRRYPRARRLLGNENLDRDEIVRLGRQRQAAMDAATEAKAKGEKEIFLLENCRGFETLLASIVGFKKIHVIIDAELPVVVDKTKVFLKKFDNVFLDGSRSKKRGFFTGMKTDSFLQSMKGGEK